MFLVNVGVRYSKKGGCVNSPPYSINVDNSIIEVPSGSYVCLYIQDKITNEIEKIFSDTNVRLANGETAFSVRDLYLPTGLNLSVDSDIDYIDSCSLYSYEGNFYVDQRVGTWYDFHKVGPFYIEVDGVKTYLENSSRSFEHRGSSAQLKAVLAPYYQSIASFLNGHGVDATYDPNIWGSYGTGGLRIKLTPEQIDSVRIGTGPSISHELFLQGYFYGTCVQYKTFEELENSPATLTFTPNTYGEESKKTYTILANHVPDDPEEINVLSLLGITEDIEMQTCFGYLPE